MAEASAAAEGGECCEAAAIFKRANGGVKWWGEAEEAADKSQEIPNKDSGYIMGLFEEVRECQRASTRWQFAPDILWQFANILGSCGLPIEAAAAGGWRPSRYVSN